MDDEQKDGPVNPKIDRDRLGRSWTKRVSGPIVYTRYSGKDSGGRPYIFFRVDEPSGSSELATTVFDAIKRMKFVERSAGGSRPTGLTFIRDRIHGKVWKLPDNPLGRTAADLIDFELLNLARSLEEESRTR